MIKKPTVFVIGAGSGVEVDMPLGSQLLSEINDILRFEQISPGHYRFSDEKMHNTLAHIAARDGNRQWPQQMFQFAKAAKIICDGLSFSESIDDFLHIHRENDAAILLGKLAISRVILGRERKSKFLMRSDGSRSVNFIPYLECWYNKLFKILSKGVDKNNVDAIFENVIFINFNYDRLLEYFLVHALCLLFDIDLSKSIEAVAKAKIIHPYGSLGAAFSNTATADALEFGEDLDLGVDLERVSQRIKIYTEQISDEDLQGNISAAMYEAEQVVFLGFGFHVQNIKLIEINAKAASGKFVFGTAVGVSDPNLTQISNLLGGVGGVVVPGDPRRGKMYLHQDLGCLQLLSNYERVISG